MQERTIHPAPVRPIPAVFDLLNEAVEGVPVIHTNHFARVYCGFGGRLTRNGKLGGTHPLLAGGFASLENKFKPATADS